MAMDSCNEKSHIVTILMMLMSKIMRKTFSDNYSQFKSLLLHTKFELW